jgi:hypothetical protein
MARQINPGIGFHEVPPMGSLLAPARPGYAEILKIWGKSKKLADLTVLQNLQFSTIFQ